MLANHNNLDLLEAVSGLGYALFMLNMPELFITEHFKFAADVGVLTTLKCVAAIVLGLRFAAFAARQKGEKKMQKPLDVATCFTWSVVLFNLVRFHSVGKVKCGTCFMSVWLMGYITCSAFALLYGYRVATNKGKLNIGTFPTFNHDNFELLEFVAGTGYIIQCNFMPKLFVQNNMTFPANEGVLATMGLLGVCVLALRAFAFLSRAAAVPGMAQTNNTVGAVAWGFCLVYNVVSKGQQQEQAFMINVGISAVFSAGFAYRALCA